MLQSKTISHVEYQTPEERQNIDYDNRRSLEVEAIFGHPLRMTQAAGADLPRISML